MNDRWPIFGGYFAVLVFWHFFADWLFQSHDEAMRKSHHWQTRFTHCLTYTIFFIPLMGFWGFTKTEAAICGSILFWSHFYEDTYIPVLLWVKHVRNPPEFRQIDDDGKRVYTDIEAFKKWITSPIGAIIMIVVDQLVHILFLMPTAYYASKPVHPW